MKLEIETSVGHSTPRPQRHLHTLTYLTLSQCHHFMCCRSSVCRMSSRDKMNVQDQSKERGVSGGLELSEEKESSPGKPAAVFSVWPEVHSECKCGSWCWFSPFQKAAQSPVRMQTLGPLPQSALLTRYKWCSLIQHDTQWFLSQVLLRRLTQAKKYAEPT